LGGFVSLKVFDMLGREVATLVNGEMKAGSYSVTFQASHLGSGVYYAVLHSGAEHLITKMLVTK